ncbi:MAG: DUF1178 family protein [Alphaproteobacteria bacterium]|nr:DUF1178 family protein [Alphaproteobacteria bacterium]
MISFNLRCANDHVFEAWFKDGKTFDRQAKQGKVACPVCGDAKIEKAPMAPNIATSKSKKAVPSEAAVAAEMKKALADLRDAVETNCDYVGDQFAEEARKIHYEETDKRNIYGEASETEAEALKEEGVEFNRIPWLPRTNS